MTQGPGDYLDYSVLEWKDFEEIWERQSRGDVVLIDGMPQKATCVRLMDSVLPDLDRHEFEMRIGAAGLWHELKQYGCDVSNETLLPFVISDIEEHGTQAVKGYLEIGQAHLNRRPSLLSVLFHIPRKEPWRWLCPGFESVVRTPDHVVFRGACFSALEAERQAQSCPSIDKGRAPC